MQTGTLFVAVLATLLASTWAYNNGLGAKPPMGWNTWCTDDLCGLIDQCTDALVRQQAKALVDENMTALGYEYVNMDDCWSAETRDANGDLQPDPKRFPHGMKALADYVHSLGLKIGLYTCAGTKTCKWGRPGSFGNYERDAKTVASWGIDFVKMDNCNLPGGFRERDYFTNMSRALNATGRPILFSLCEWGNQDVQSWGGDVAQMYRIQMDHLPFWYLPFPKAAGQGIGSGTWEIIEYIATLQPSTFVRQYAWMDPDFLMTLFYNPKLRVMTYEQSKSEFSFWALWSAPMLVATQISNMSAAKKSIVMNEEVIAINRDDVNTAGDRIYNDTEGRQVWSKPLANGDICVILFNSNLLGDGKTVSVKWTQLGLDSNSTLIVRDLWAHRELGPHTGGISFDIKPDDVMMLRLSPQGPS